ncbi:MAG: hypothetical protein PHD61_07735 [Bacteroidales bacterium]|nr:hypothetical protein [Lentimicrobiaceae bacterium]MDD5695181.1 hypothetical protein [Bacteroidales bacterium]
MKKLFKPLACICSIIAIILMLIGLILSFTSGHLLNVSAYTWYFSAINFILLAILFHLAGTPAKTE